MFRLESQDNPLDLLVAHTGSALVQNQLAKQAEANKLRRVEHALSGLNEESSELDWLQAINQAPEEYQERLSQFHENIAKGRQERQKIAQEQPTDEGAKLAGMDPAEYKRLNPTERKAAIKAAGSKKVTKDESEEVKQILLESGKTEEEAEKLKTSLTPTSARTIYSSAKQIPPFESSSEKHTADRQADFIKNTTKDYQAAQGSSQRLDQMVGLAKSKKLSTPLMIKTMQSLGLPLAVLGNPFNEQYQKLENDFVKDVTDYFPGTVRVFEAQTYLKTIPGLMVSDQGKELVAKNLKLQDDAKKLTYKAMREILSENKNVAPMDLDFQVMDRVGPELEKLGDEFRSNIEKAFELAPKITMYGPDGGRYELPTADTEALQDAINQGFKFHAE